MRVYELSKQLGVSAKKLLEALKKEGVAVKSHMSSIDASAVVLLQKKFRAPAKSQLALSDTTQTRKEVMQKERTKRRAPQKSKRSKFYATKPKLQATFASKPSIQESVQPVVQEKKEIVVEPMTVSAAAQKMGKSVSDVILTLLKWKILAAKNQLLSQEVVKRLAHHYDITPVKREAVVREKLRAIQVEDSGELKDRAPVIVVLGHVDHGKTTLLDFIRKTRVVAKEKGGITQHLGAYEVATNHGNLVFLDTPGHEAFPKMRQRGIRVADIGVLVVAADDGIMPQTVEAITHLKTMGIPVIVAINKIDKVDSSRIETVKRQLAEHDLLPEEWGGQVVCMPISALKGQGVDSLLEMIALQAQLLELRASQDGLARCYVLESKLEKGRGAVATLLCQCGALKVGDFFLCGSTGGRVSSIKDSHGKVLQMVGPSIPVQVAGFDALPGVGDLFSAVSKREVLRSRQQKERHEFVSRAAQEGAINLLIKADANSSKEALVDAIYKLSKKSEVGFAIISAGVGNINESDVELAYSTSATIIGLHAKAESNAFSLAQRRGVTIELYDVIYKLLEALEERAESEKVVELVKTKIGQAIVRRVFDIKGVGIVAGSYVDDGRFVRDGYVVAWRGKEKIGEGSITSLQREKKTVKEVSSGFECGFVVEGITDWEVDDRAECFIDIPKK